MEHVCIQGTSGTENTEMHLAGFFFFNRKTTTKNIFPNTHGHT